MLILSSFRIIKPSPHLSPFSSRFSPHRSPTPPFLSLHLAVSDHFSLPALMDPVSKSNPIPTRIAHPIKNYKNRRLKIAIMGFGQYGQFLAKTLVSQGHNVIAHSRSDQSLAVRSIGISFFHDARDLCKQHPDVILLCMTINSVEEVLKSLPLHSLKRNTLFVDVMSVKEFAKSLLLKVLPENFDIICSHPMFGPQSGKFGWRGLYFVYENVRVGNEDFRIDRCRMFLEIFEREGCEMVEMSCSEHDKHAAGAQFITHTVGRVLKMLNLEPTPINTKGYESLLELMENVGGDSFDLYYALFMFNKNAIDMLERFDSAFKELRKQLVGSLHEVVSKQLFSNRADGRPTHGNQVSGSTSIVNLTSLRSQDSAQAFHDMLQLSSCIDDNSKLKIGIVGFGNFGQFLAKTMVQQGHTVLTYSRSDYSDAAQKLGVSYFSNMDNLCEEHPDVILLCTSILSTGKVVQSLPVQRLKRSTLFVDVLSVKEFPKNLLLKNLPLDFDVLCTHPMFGPDSGKNGWNGLSFVFDKVRVGADEERLLRCDRFLSIFALEGCTMIEMSCAEHDMYAAGSQFITHTVGRILEKLGLESMPVNTKGYNILLNLVENTAGDSFDLYYGLFMYNPNAMEQLERLDLAFESLKKQLFGQIHGLLRKQLVDDEETSQVLTEQHTLLNPPRVQVERPISLLTLKTHAS